jgi:hypothetical protein
MIAAGGAELAVRAQRFHVDARPGWRGRAGRWRRVEAEVGQAGALGEGDLGLHQVNAGDGFGDGVEAWRRALASMKTKGGAPGRPVVSTRNSKVPRLA